jgi:hypothetical protein
MHTSIVDYNLLKILVPIFVSSSEHPKEDLDLLKLAYDFLRFLGSLRFISLSIYINNKTYDF